MLWDGLNNNREPAKVQVDALGWTKWQQGTRESASRCFGTDQDSNREPAKVQVDTLGWTRVAIGGPL